MYRSKWAFLQAPRTARAWRLIHLARCILARLYFRYASGSPTIYDYDMHCVGLNQNPAPGQEESHVCAGVGEIPSNVSIGNVDYFRIAQTWYKIPAGKVLITKLPYIDFYDISGAAFYDVNGLIAELHKGSVPRDYVNRVVDEVYPWMPYTFE